MKKYDIHLFVCLNERDDGRPACGKKHGEKLIDIFKEFIKKHNIKASWRVNKAGCLGICNYGPTVAVYPEGVFYVNVQTESDVEEIVISHLKNNQPVNRLLLENASIENK
ncbi:MAG: (2Fe-2S) ferredoxin domain-containing protein [Bacteroidia bacterium]|nr:(2Fe-2S) ferredoxin domain-containing protein [Bacteroidia bacterium]